MYISTVVGINTLLYYFKRLNKECIVIKATSGVIGEKVGNQMRNKSIYQQKF